MEIKDAWSRIGYLTDHFTTFEPQNRDIHELYLVQKRRLTDDEALNCGMFGRVQMYSGRNGACSAGGFELQTKVLTG